LAVEHPFRALVLFSYPLHRPGFPDQLRTEHWPRIECPVLLLCGESDPFARPELLRREVKKLRRHELVTYPTAGHGLKGADIEGLINALGEDQVDLVGHDWGSLVGWPFVSRHPKLVRTWTSLSIPHPLALGRASGLDGGSSPDPEQRDKSSYVGLFHKVGKAE